MHPRDYGYTRWPTVNPDAELARIKAQDEKRARDRAAWNRLCGMAAPIGRPIDL